MMMMMMKMNVLQFGKDVILLIVVRKTLVHQAKLQCRQSYCVYDYTGQSSKESREQTVFMYYPPSSVRYFFITIWFLPICPFVHSYNLYNKTLVLSITRRCFWNCHIFVSLPQEECATQASECLNALQQEHPMTISS